MPMPVVVAAAVEAVSVHQLLKLQRTYSMHKEMIGSGLVYLEGSEDAGEKLLHIVMNQQMTSTCQIPYRNESTNGMHVPNPLRISATVALT